MMPRLLLCVPFLYTFLINGTLSFESRSSSSSSSSRSSARRNSNNVPPRKSMSSNLVNQQQAFQFRMPTQNLLVQDKEDDMCDPCENPFDNDDAETIELDRREAAFAMLGTLWATTAVIPTSVIFSQAANAASGDEAKMALPNVVERMTDRVTKECLVESLGNRECLLYASDGSKIYQAQSSKQVLLDRIEKASAALATIPELVADKKWSKVSGAMTGPMGELVKNMGQLANLSENGDTARQKIKVVKTDLYSIDAAIQKKDGDQALKFHTAATNDLNNFLKSL